MKKKISPNLIIVFVMLGYTLIYMDKTVIGTAMIPITKEFSLSSTQTGLIVSLFFLGYSLMQIPCGYLADRIGYRKVLLGSLSLCAVFSLLFGLVGILPLFLVVRFMAGVSDAGYPSSSAKFVAENYPQEKRPFAQSLLLSTGGIGGMLAAVVGVNMIANFGWRSIYFVLSALFVLALLGIMIFMPSKHNSGLVKIPTKINFSEVVKNKNVVVLFFAMMSYNIVIYSLTTWMPTFLVNTYSVTLSKVSIVLAVAALLGICSALLSGKLFGKLIGKEKPMLLTAAIFLAAILVIASTVRQYIFVAILLSIAIFACEFLFTGLFTWPHKILDKNIIGSSIGVINTGGTLGGFIGPTLFGIILDSSNGSFVAAFIAIGIFSLCSGLLALLVINKKVVG